MSRRFDVIVVGAGPAGIAAAAGAAESGKSVALLDDNPRAGGQIWRHGAALPKDARAWLAKLTSSPVTHMPQSRVYDHPMTGVISAECADNRIDLLYSKLIVVTGARELFLPFPGWTLRNVFGAGGLDAMVRGGLAIAGKRVVVAGTGPLLLAVAAHLARCGANVIAICEQAPLHRMASFGASMFTHSGKLLQAAQYRWVTRGARMHFGCWVIAANGEQELKSVILRRRDREWKIDCDYLACGFHLVPNTELAQLVGCRMENGFVATDQFQQTSVTNVFAAGEPTGIGGVDLALLEGRIAGLAASGRIGEAQRLVPQARKASSFVRALREVCTLDPKLRTLAGDTTIVCRCEDVSYGALRKRSSWRDAKLHTRCGMGPCQGRICGPATEFLFDWKVDSIRPPVFPALVSSLARAGAGSADSQEDI